MPDLPASVRDMIAVIGLPDTLAFVRAFGGKRVYIPKRLTSTGAAVISEAIGEAATEKLAGWFGDGFLEVPRCVACLNHERNVEIIRNYSADTSINTLVEKYKLSHRHLRRILKCTDATTLLFPLEEGWDGGGDPRQQALNF
ncbi:MAG: hypothetical protein LBB65_07140 [Burkholderiales bacterium]|jgi:AraC-like DNA-binding protein|nr:hypothetical protein [Burkholderiales bacterium]